LVLIIVDDGHGPRDADPARVGAAWPG
jgi:hypothetical protein